MITNWLRHWDNLQDNSTFFSVSMFKKGMAKEKIRENTETIFIKRDKETKKSEKAWVGTVSHFKHITYKDTPAIMFKVSIKEEIPIPATYKNYPEGWYVETAVEETSAEVKETFLDPQFFGELLSTANWETFERQTYYLIRCMGLHTTHAFRMREQKGRADGFFKLGNLAVLYDCTLERNFEKSKSAQIENYCQQLKKGTIEYDDKRIDIQNCKKSVWVIMQEGERRILKEIDKIQIKAVSIREMIRIYRKRIVEDMDEIELEKELENI